MKMPKTPKNIRLNCYQKGLILLHEINYELLPLNYARKASVRHNKEYPSRRAATSPGLGPVTVSAKG